MATQSNISELILRLKDEVSKNAPAIRGSLRDVERGIASFSAEALKVGATGAVMAGAILSLAKSAANYADEMGKASQRTGVGVETLSGLKFAADLADVEFAQLEKALIKFSSKIVDVARGNDEATRSFSAVGLSIKNQNGTLKTADALLFELADKFAKMPDGVHKTALAADLFGERIGARLIPLLNGGASGMRQFTEEARKLGLVVSPELAAKAEAFNDQLKILQSLVIGIKNSIGSELLPVLNLLIRDFADLLKLNLPLPQSLAAINQELERLAEKRRRLFEDIQRSEDFGGDPKRRELLEADLDDILNRQRQLFQLRRRLSGAQGGPVLTPGETAEQLKKRAKDLEDFTKAAVGQTRDEFDKLDKELGEAMLDPDQRLREQLKADAEEARRIHALMIEQTRAAMDQEDQDRMQAILTARDQEFEIERKHRERLGELFLEFAQREREATEARRQAIQDTFGSLFDSITSGMETTVQGILLGTQKASDAFKNMFRNIAISAAEEMVKLAVIKPLKESFLSGVANIARAFIPFPQFAEGGMVPGPIGRPQLAVVHGGETVTPPGRGAMNVFIDARGAERGVSLEIMKAIRVAEERAIIRSVNQVREEKVRGGAFGKAFK